MFLGHYAVGCAARAASLGSAEPSPTAPAPRGPSLGTWFLAVQWLDLVWPFLVLAGIEQVRVAPGLTPATPLDFVHYPYTHSALAALVWAALFAGVYRWRTGNGRGALWLAGGVFSHWVLDLVVHVPDLPLYPGGPKVGLGLWHSMAGTLVVEIGLMVVGAVLYTRATRPADAVGRYAWWGLLAFLAVAYASAVFGPPPPSGTAVGASALALWLLVPWGYWIDRHRVPRATAPAAA